MYCLNSGGFWTDLCDICTIHKCSYQTWAEEHLKGHLPVVTSQLFKAVGSKLKKNKRINQKCSKKGNVGLLFFVNKGLGQCNEKVQSSVGWRSKSIAFESKRVVNYCLLDGKKTLRKRKGSMFSLCQHIRLYGDSSHVIAISLSAHMTFTFEIFPI